MKGTRSLLFYETREGEGITPMNFQSVDLNLTIASVFSRLGLAIKISQGLPKPANIVAFSEEYNFYDWNLDVLSHDTMVARVPNPGIVFAIQKSELAHSFASGIKLLLEGTTDEANRRLLDSFLKGHKGRLPSQHLAQQLSDAVEAKPGAFGFHLDVKKFLLTIFGRNKR